MELDNIGLWELAIAFLIIMIGIILIRVTVSFDINKWQKARQEKRKIKMKNTCPHCRIKNIAHKNGDISFLMESFFISPPGKAAWICQQCNCTVYDKDYPEEIMAYWLDMCICQESPKPLKEQQEKFLKLARKQGIV